MDRRQALAGMTAFALAQILPEGSAEQTGDLPAGPAAAAGQSSAVHLNQCGYLSAAEKIASVVLPAGGGEKQAFTILTMDGSHKVFTGRLSRARMDQASGDLIAQADFSSFTTPGRYKLQAGSATSDPFPINSVVYRDALQMAMRSYYGQRCGCAVDLGGGYRHPSCHPVGMFHPSSGRAGSIGNSGGWHDAGDYGRYVVNSGISVATLLWAWELYPGSLSGLNLRIPESGGALPDVLAEVRWNLNWMQAMQDRQDGGVWHKQTSTDFCGFIMPQDDGLPSDIIGTGAVPFKSTGPTAHLAAVMAIAARCYQPYDVVYAEACLQAARSAWAWLTTHPEVLFRNPPGVTTGEYGTRSCRGEVLWAAAELFRTTADPVYARAFEAGVPKDLEVTSPGWNAMLPFALWTYCMAAKGTDQALRARIVRATSAAARKRMQQAKASGYGNTLGMDYAWGSNGAAANDSLLLLLANRLDPDMKAQETAFGNLHYLLGRNCFGVCWVTQVGVRPFQSPHHRPSVADGVAAPWPGLLSGGPNARVADSVAKTLGERPPMRMWVDDWRAFSVNEVAINWNAPLVFLLAAATQQG